jgi:plasmid maintenance system antidote protein VapI
LIRQRGKEKMAEHTRLAILLQNAAASRGSQAALARELGLNAPEISDLINSKRFVTLHQALRIERVLGVEARALLVEAATAKIDEALEAAGVEFIPKNGGRAGARLRK